MPPAAHLFEKRWVQKLLFARPRGFPTLQTASQIVNDPDGSEPDEAVNLNLP
jgi:hypothetical protein